jgi:mono/diheme cytochrome c family protein
MPVVRTLVALFFICIAAAVAFFAPAWHAAIDPIAPQAQNFPPDLIRHGATLAALGDCITCHTAPGGRAFAGGLAVPTPFGTIYSTNITPDANTGIGRWSEAAFRRALREGVDRGGRQLYPAFPYDHFTLTTDDDVHALYAYAMTRDPVRAAARPNDLAFPFNIRPLLAGWKLLFFRQGPYRTDPAQSAAWNRGAYLVEGLAHCGACHTPRNALGAEQADNRFGGGEAEGWSAYALNQASPAPVHWDQAALGFYLRNGWHEAHGVALGPMASVLNNLAAMPDADIAAIATYMSGVTGEPNAEQRRSGEALVEQARQRKPGNSPATAVSQTGGQSANSQSGALIYQAACATCHDSGRPPPFGGIDLALSTAPSAPVARNVINVVLWGLPATDAQHGPIMPGFANVMTDRQVADLVAYLRSRFGNKPPWTAIDKDVADARSGVSPVNVYPAPAIDPNPRPLGQVASQRETPR